MTDKPDDMKGAPCEATLSRRDVLVGVSAAGAAAAAAWPRELLAALANPTVSGARVDAENRFPYFRSTPVSYFNVVMQDNLWAPRQKVIHDVTVPWATRHWDAAGGLEEFKKRPATYKARLTRGDPEAIKFIEAMAAVDGLRRDATVEGLIKAWSALMIKDQASDGYFTFGYPIGADPTKRWQTAWWMEEDYAPGHYMEGAIAYREVTGDDTIYRSALRAIDNMVSVFLDSNKAYTSGDSEITQALMRLYGVTGDTRYLRLCGWLIAQRGHHDGRKSYGKYGQDDIPVAAQRTIEGHAVRAAYLYNSVTEYVGATGDAAYRDAVLAVWDDFVNHKMYIHGAGGLKSTKNEGYGTKPDFIPPDDCYGESCSVVGNFQWAHNLFRLTGEASYLDTAERMLYNAFYASLSLKGDEYFYENAAQQDTATGRFAWHPVPCCPPNMVRLFSKVGGFFYSTDKQGIYVKHYGASEAKIPFRSGVSLTQRTDFPWDGKIILQVQPTHPTSFALRLRKPAWANSHSLTVNGEAIDVSPKQGWLVIERHWKNGDTVELTLPMEIERVSMPPRFEEYANLVALQRGPVVYCLEEQDIDLAAPPQGFEAYLPTDATITAEHRPDFLGGVTVLRTDLRLPDYYAGSETPVPVTFIPYGVWNNRTPGAMRTWLLGRKLSYDELINRELPSNPPNG
jgi:uncharacterized protein